MDDYKIEVHTFPMLDTGIGQEAGFANDAELMAAAAAERAALPLEVREAMDEIDREVERRMLGL